MLSSLGLESHLYSFSFWVIRGVEQSRCLEMLQSDGWNNATEDYISCEFLQCKTEPWLHYSDGDSHLSGGQQSTAEHVAGQGSDTSISLNSKSCSLEFRPTASSELHSSTTVTSMCSLALQTKYDPFVPGVCCAGGTEIHWLSQHILLLAVLLFVICAMTTTLWFTGK